MPKIAKLLVGNPLHVRNDLIGDPVLQHPLVRHVRGDVGCRRRLPCQRVPSPLREPKGVDQFAALDSVAVLDRRASCIESHGNAAVRGQTHIGLRPVAGAKLVIHIGERCIYLVVPIDRLHPLLGQESGEDAEDDDAPFFEQLTPVGDQLRFMHFHPRPPVDRYLISNACLFLPRLSLIGLAPAVSISPGSVTVASSSRTAPSAILRLASLFDGVNPSAVSAWTMFIPSPSESVGKSSPMPPPANVASAVCRAVSAASRPWSRAVVSVASTILAWLISAPSSFSSLPMSSSDRSVNSFRNVPTSASCVFRQNCQ